VHGTSDAIAEAHEPEREREENDGETDVGEIHGARSFDAPLFYDARPKETLKAARRL
jgi:hypothetical protein